MFGKDNKEMTISTTILDAYDICKNIPNMTPELCRQKAMNEAPQAINAFLQSYDLCLMTGQKEWCQRAFAYDVPTPPVIPFLLGLALGWIIKRH